MTDPGNASRRLFLRGVAAMAAMSSIPVSSLVASLVASLVTSKQAAANERAVATRAIPSTGERIPAVGLGSWITFNVGDDPMARERCAHVMDAFFRAGGRLVDSSPMYGSAQAVIGQGLERLGRRGDVFSAEKVWTSWGISGPEQIEKTRGFWGVPSFDLLQIHNLLDWENHLPTLLEMKAGGRLRYVGITTSHGRRHGDLARIMERQPLDFVQLTYNPVDREAEDRLLPIAQARGIAVLVNRPFRRKQLVERMAGVPLPGFAAELGARSWAQLLLKFVLSHPAVTCPIPATTVPAHAVENLEAANGPMPDPNLRERIARAVAEA